MTNILNTDVKIEDVESILRKKFKTKSVIGEWKAEEIGKGKGFLSQMAKISLVWDPPDPNLPNSAIAKITGLENLTALTNAMKDTKMADKFEIAKENIDKIHNCEVAVYEILGEQRPVCIPEVWGTVRMGGEGAPFILMEDLSDVAGSQDMLYGLRLQQLLQIAEQLASLHAWSLTRDGWKHPDVNMNFGQLACGENFDKDMEEFIEEIRRPRWVEMLGKEVVENAHKLLVTKDQVLWSTKSLHRELGIPDVLVHGDFWNNNILIGKDASGTPNRDILAFVDWQLSHPGSPAEDLSRVLTTSVSAETRREHSLTVFEHYYKCLEAKLGGPVPFSFAQFTEAYEKLLRVSAGLFLPIVPGFVDMIASGALVNIDPEEGKKTMTQNMRALMEDTLKLIG